MFNNQSGDEAIGKWKLNYRQRGLNNSQFMGVSQ